jgi:hypothetical protein
VQLLDPDKITEPVEPAWTAPEPHHGVAVPLDDGRRPGRRSSAGRDQRRLPGSARRGHRRQRHHRRRLHRRRPALEGREVRQDRQPGRIWPDRQSGRLRAVRCGARRLQDRPRG